LGKQRTKHKEQKPGEAPFYFPFQTTYLRVLIMAERVNGKVAIVTGAAQGIGRACALLLAREGARVVVADIQDEKGLAVVDQIRSDGHEAVYQHCDIIDEDQCAGLIQFTVGHYGRIDVLVNNAGWFPRSTLAETTTELWDRVININLRGAFYCCKYAIPQLRSGGGGSIVNVGSINGIQGLENLIAYASAKGGLLALTRTLAGAHAKDRIRANYIIPGWVLTEGEISVQASRGVNEEDLRQAGETLLLGRHQTADDIAQAVIYLASDESSQVTGTILHVDAGATTLPIQSKAPYVG
jgi:NAD(P)-dependent dehydrogenase (short-subunit alcohol dehydrogenase family)